MNQSNENTEESNVTLLPASNKKIDLHDVHSVRREIGAVYRDMRQNRIESQEGTRLVYVLNVLLKAHETCTLASQIEMIKLELGKR